VRNLSVREERVHLFEIGKTFAAQGSPVLDRLRDTGTVEGRRLGLLLMGDLEPDSWAKAGIRTDFYLAKGLVERALGVLGISGGYDHASQPFLHPGRSAGVTVGGRTAGWVGEVHPLVLKAFNLPDGVVAAELDAELLLECAREDALFEDLITYPAVEQDLALVVARDVPAEQAVRAARDAGGELLREVAVFDVYEGPQVGEGRKSLALRLTFRSAERTLSEAEINEVRAHMLNELKRSLGAELRG
jgi:phenylalanyl-tRNA synthetase beta chain